MLFTASTRTSLSVISSCVLLLLASTVVRLAAIVYVHIPGTSHTEKTIEVYIVLVSYECRYQFVRKCKERLVILTTVISKRSLHIRTGWKMVRKQTAPLVLARASSNTYTYTRTAFAHYIALLALLHRLSQSSAMSPINTVVP